MSETSGLSASRAALDANEQEQRNRRRLLDLVMQISDALKPKVSGGDVLSDRDALAEKAMMAYILRYGEKDCATIANYAYRMADAMIAESHKSQS
jgi:hypothetical protein